VEKIIRLHFIGEVKWQVASVLAVLRA